MINNNVISWMGFWTEIRKKNLRKNNHKLYMDIQSSTTGNFQISINRGMGQQNMVYLYKRVIPNHKNKLNLDIFYNLTEA